MMQRAMRLPVTVLLLAACGHPPPAKPVAAERPVRAVADIAGRWLTSDDLDWAYTLALDPSGTIDLVIDRNKMGRCEEKGKLAPAAPPSFQLTYERNDCNREYAGAQLQLKVASFTGDSLTIVITGYGSEEKHVFTRAPVQ